MNGKIGLGIAAVAGVAVVVSGVTVYLLRDLIGVYAIEYMMEQDLKKHNPYYTSSLEKEKEETTTEK